ncbi:M20/M25/M40 family metallo-hydrolase [Cupriavidus basilensis]|uniref:M20/M25/M40 family metallo-hydrolase n=1 Tax=Cupriavidus basilensis TaxID=68895 RepID=UPI002845FD8D|nr:M20/M25/M40 family metallo-hydrolase [Cupriavidus basilensis]MDR3382787.1 M20/M25/M40 family metallo-hydrolase [Cupriavidus basilensis]
MTAAAPRQDTAAPAAGLRAIGAFIEAKWDGEILPALHDYIRVPAKSPAFDAGWQARGLLDRVVCSAAAWAEAQKIAGMTVEVIRLPGRTPLLFFEIPATADASADTILFYGHLDKQPEFDGWRRDLGPWEPKYENGKLYGRGGADDGYALYAALAAVMAVRAGGASHPRCVGIIETCEESGSYDLPAYLDALANRLGRIGLVVCLDSGAGNYDQLWMVTSLRGYVSGRLEVQVLDEGVHSGDASGIVPSSFRVLRHVLDRLEDSGSGEILPASFHCEVPPQRQAQAEHAARQLGDLVWKRFAWACGADGASVLPTTTDPATALIRRAWRPALSVVGAEGLPPLATAGNVLRPRTAFKLSLRLPPLVDSAGAAQELKRLLESHAPYNARVAFVPDKSVADGWNAPAMAPWLASRLEAASQQYFGASCGYLGQGGTIPLMGMLEKAFPLAQFMVCGVLGPNANAHGPNEFLHVPYAKRLTASIASVIGSWQEDAGQ